MEGQEVKGRRVETQEIERISIESSGCSRKESGSSISCQEESEAQEAEMIEI